MPKKPRPHRVWITRYHLPDGTRCKKGDPGALRSRERSETYYGVVGGERVSLETTDEGQAWVRLNHLLRKAAERAAGITDRTIEFAALPLPEHLTAWAGAVRDKGTSEPQVQLLRGHLDKLASLAGWARLPDLTAETLLRALARLTSPPPEGEGLSAQTRNHYTRHAKQFSAWCVDSDRLARDPFRIVKLVSTEADRRHDRRAPTGQEVGKLFGYLAGEGCPARRGMSGPCRALLYKVSMATGFRAGEMRSLTWDRFDLRAGTVTVLAAYSRKRKRTATQPLPPWLVKELKTWRKAGGGLWSALPGQFPGRVLKADLAACGVPWEVPGPEGQPLFFDFHALRHWYCTEIVNQPGISPKTVMELTRHSTPTLPFKTYGKKRPADLAEAVGKIPPPPSQVPDEEE